MAAIGAARRAMDHRRAGTRWGIGFALLSAVFFAQWCFANSRHGLSDGAGHEFGGDFVLFWSSAQLAAQHLAAQAYDPEAFRVFREAVTGVSESDRIFVYPPVAMLLTLPLAALPFLPGLTVWPCCGVAPAALSRARLGWRLASLAMVGAPAAILNLIAGQNGYFTAALFGGGLMLIDAPGGCRRPLRRACLQAAARAGVPVCAGGGRPCAPLSPPRSRRRAGRRQHRLLGATAWIEFRSHAAAAAADRPAFWHRSRRCLSRSEPGAGVAVAYAAQLAPRWRAGPYRPVWRGRALPTKAATLVVATFFATPYAWDYDGGAGVLCRLAAREGSDRFSAMGAADDRPVWCCRS